MAGAQRDFGDADLGDYADGLVKVQRRHVPALWDKLIWLYWRRTFIALTLATALATGVAAYLRCSSPDATSKWAGAAGAAAAVTLFLTACTTGLRAAEQRAQDSRQGRRQYALEMLREWNHQTAEARARLEGAFPGHFECCTRLTPEQVAGQVTATNAHVDDVSSRGGSKRDNAVSGIRGDTIRLLNYFEFVSAAYLSGKADRDIILRSFAATMVRYYCILYVFLREQKRQLGHNPWAPYSKFVAHVLELCATYQGISVIVGIDRCVTEGCGPLQVGNSAEGRNALMELMAVKGLVPTSLGCAHKDE